MVDMRVDFKCDCTFLPSCCGFSFALGHGVSFFGGFQHSPVDGCSAASFNFGVLTGEDEHMSFILLLLHLENILGQQGDPTSQS